MMFLEQKSCVDLLSQDIQKIDEMNMDLQLYSNIESYFDSVDGATTPKIKAYVVNTNSNSQVKFMIREVLI